MSDTTDEREGREEAAGRTAPVSNPHPPVTALTTPCTVVQLHNWLKDSNVLTNNVRHTASVTTTASSIGIS